MSAQMKLFYSAERRGFFSPGLHADMPSDAVHVTAKRHAALMAGQAEGYEIVPDDRGRPQLRCLSPSTLAEAQAACMHAIKREAGRRIDQRMPLWRQINALRDGSDPGFHDIDLIRQASNLIEEQMMAATTVQQVAAFPIERNPLWPEFDDGGRTDA